MMKNNTIKNFSLYDRTIFWLMVGLSGIGFIMVSSSSMVIGEEIWHDPLHFMKRDLLYSFFSFLLFFLILQVSTSTWKKYSTKIFLFTFLILLIEIGIGRSVNGASRWITFGYFCLQPSELIKISTLLYLSKYLSKKDLSVRNKFLDFFKPISILIILSVVLVTQPDLGTVVLLFISIFCVLFVAGAKIQQLFLSIIPSVFIGLLLVLKKEYPIGRIISFLDPWKDPMNTGYQLIQSLIALGRGKLYGQGLGNSVQKFLYLPESHNDFIFSILGEEFGCFGTISVLWMIFYIVFRSFTISKKALKIKENFSGFLSCSVGIYLGIQTTINIGASIGILPTKGLTLPLISYGGSNFLTVLISIAFLLRIDFENRLANLQAFSKRS